MTDTNQHHNDFPKTFRWLVLDDVGMKLRIAFISHEKMPSTKLLVLENGDRMPEAVGKLGFTRTESGYWFKRETSFNPKEFMEVFPGARIDKNYPSAEIVLDLGAKLDFSDKPALNALRAELNDRVLLPRKFDRDIPSVDQFVSKLAARIQEKFGNATVDEVHALLEESLPDDLSVKIPRPR